MMIHLAKALASAQYSDVQTYADLTQVAIIAALVGGVAFFVFIFLVVAAPRTRKWRLFSDGVVGLFFLGWLVSLIAASIR